MDIKIKSMLGKLVKDLRKLQKISQKELARRSELHVNTIRKIEKADIEARISTLLFLAKGLGMRLDEIMVLFVNKYFNFS